MGEKVGISLNCAKFTVFGAFLRKFGPGDGVGSFLADVRDFPNSPVMGGVLGTRNEMRPQPYAVGGRCAPPHSNISPGT